MQRDRGRPRVEPERQRVKVQIWIKPYHRDRAYKYAQMRQTSLSALCREILEQGITKLSMDKLMRPRRGERDRFAPVCHRNGTVTYWSGYRQQWIKRASQIPEDELRAMYKYRERVQRHLGIKQEPSS